MMRSDLVLANRDSRDELGVEVALALGQGIAETKASGDRDGPGALYCKMERNRKKESVSIEGKLLSNSPLFSSPNCLLIATVEDTKSEGKDKN